MTNAVSAQQSWTPFLLDRDGVAPQPVVEQILAPPPGYGDRYSEASMFDHLARTGVLGGVALVQARGSWQRQGTPAIEAALAAPGVDSETLLAAVAGHLGARLLPPGRIRADRGLVARIGLARCLELEVLPLRRAGGATVIALADPSRFAGLARLLAPEIGPLRLAIARQSDMATALAEIGRRHLTEQAELRVPADLSCRDWAEPRVYRYALSAALILASLLLVAPVGLMAVLTGIAILSLIASMCLKIAATWTALRAARVRRLGFRSARGRPVGMPSRLPMVSVMVPLFRETEIAGRLIRRLSRLTYPKERLEICLVLEEDDQMTRAALGRIDLPFWMRVIVVPRGTVKTKPRALNFALDLCRGDIVGIYDAEDAPAPDQIDEVVRIFAEEGPKTACLQGVLDFYNPHSNWLSRCFTIEYASWFRVILPGIERLGLAVPLGGTTLFFRREALVKLGGWDAHNVTEDADLGIRLARAGYRTSVLSTVTEEEANCRGWPWVRQRSRWLKGYAMTWATHMRRPRRLWRELGARRFWGMQVLFLGTLSQFLLAPLLWTFWAIPLGLPHPLRPILGPAGLMALGGLFLISELVNMAINLIATRATRHRGLAWWIPTLHVYFILGTLAAWKGMIEVVTRPYYWDKTSHGIAHAGTADPARPAASVGPAGPVGPAARSGDPSAGNASARHQPGNADVTPRPIPPAPVLTAAERVAKALTSGPGDGTGSQARAARSLATSLNRSAVFQRCKPDLSIPRGTQF